MSEFQNDGAAPVRKARGFGFERRAEILAAAERVFVAHGYEGSTVRRIADEVGGATAIAETTADPRDQIKAVLRAHILFGLKNKPAYHLVFTEGAREIRKDHGVTRDKAGEYYRILPAMVEKLSKAGRVPRGSVHCVAQTLWAGCYGLTTYLINMPAFGWVEVDELISLMVDGLVDGLTPERN